MSNYYGSNPQDIPQTLSYGSTITDNESYASTFSNEETLMNHYWSENDILNTSRSQSSLQEQEKQNREKDKEEDQDGNGSTKSTHSFIHESCPLLNGDVKQKSLLPFPIPSLSSMSFPKCNPPSLPKWELKSTFQYQLQQCQLAECKSNRPSAQEYYFGSPSEDSHEIVESNASENGDVNSSTATRKKYYRFTSTSLTPFAALLKQPRGDGNNCETANESTHAISGLLRRSAGTCGKIHERCEFKNDSCFAFKWCF